MLNVFINNLRTSNEHVVFYESFKSCAFRWKTIENRNSRIALSRFAARFQCCLPVRNFLTSRIVQLVLGRELCGYRAFKALQQTTLPVSARCEPQADSYPTSAPNSNYRLVADKPSIAQAPAQRDRASDPGQGCPGLAGALCLGMCAGPVSGRSAARVLKTVRHELDLIRTMRYAPYFLTVFSIVRFARSQGILCQGRGSAANSAVCYILGITSIDPSTNDLLFERFVSQERDEPPDIDVDFEHERREEVIQWIYKTYTKDKAALCATVTRYRAKGAIRDVGKALGLPEDVIKALSSGMWAWSEEVPDRNIRELNLNPDDRRLALTLKLAQQLMGAPRHLGQHPGGFVLTHDRLDDLVPIEPATMKDRQIIEWDKDDVEALKFMKVDVLALGMLTCMAKAFDLIREHKGQDLDLSKISQEDAATYAMIRKADTLGTFQIESRAQMAMLPRLKPRTFYDLVVQVAIVRPGPIQGDMVHPYLRRREGKEPVEYPTPELEAVLGKTLGVPLFQESAMRVAMVCAGFTGGEADQLRKSMATFKFTGGVSRFKDKLVSGMVKNGYSPEFAEKTFSQLEGFGSYGFPESHAASFALIAYASNFIKCHYPDVFCAALLNSQPMGFYAPAQIVGDAIKHGSRCFRSASTARAGTARWKTSSLPNDMLSGSGFGR